MDNAANALRMGGAIMFFVLAFTLMISLYSQSRDTMDKVLESVDTRNYYQHVGATNANVTRIVGLETIIPTLYTYVTSTDNSVRINIVDQNDKVKQVFDDEIENIIGVEANKGTSSYNNTTLFKRYNDPGVPTYLFKAPWHNGTFATQMDRVTAYIYGKEVRINDSSLKVNYKNNNLLKLADSASEKWKFEEKYIEYQSGGKVYWDEDYEESLVITDGKIKTVITYKKR